MTTKQSSKLPGRFPLSRRRFLRGAGAGMSVLAAGAFRLPTTGAQAKAVRPAPSMPEPKFIETNGMGEFIDDFEKYTVADCGHWTQQEKPEEFNRVTLDWMKRKFGGVN